MKIVRILNYAFPIIIGAICSSMGTWLDIGINNIIQILLILFFSLIFSILLYLDGKREIESLQMITANSFEIKFLIFKNIILQLSAIIIGSLCSSLGNWDKSQNAFIIKVDLIIILGILYIAFVIVSVMLDEKCNKRKKILFEKVQEINNMYSAERDIIFYTNIETIKNISIKKDKIKLGVMDIREIEGTYFLLCSSLKHIIAKYDTADFCVAYSKRYGNDIRMIAFSGNNLPLPSEFQQTRQISKDNHIDSEIIKESRKNIYIYYNKDKLIKNGSAFDYYNKICQNYFAIPIWRKNEIQGIFQLIYYNKSVYFDDENLLKSFAVKSLIQYTSTLEIIDELYEFVCDSIMEF